MNRRNLLLYLIRKLLLKELSVNCFCDIYTNAFFPNTPKKECNEFEYELLRELADMTARYSEDERDPAVLSGFYFDARSVLNKAKAVLNSLDETFEIVKWWED